MRTFFMYLGLSVIAISLNSLSLPARASVPRQSYPNLHVEFTSQLMGFVDDVEFYFDPDGKSIQVRSASRLGESDLGVNRQRIEAIRSLVTGLNQRC
jgi:uncharacterized protein (DUF1499 family)